jgi:hypothetical protein
MFTVLGWAQGQTPPAPKRSASAVPPPEQKQCRLEGRVVDAITAVPLRRATVKLLRT